MRKMENRLIPLTFDKTHSELSDLKSAFKVLAFLMWLSKLLQIV